MKLWKGVATLALIASLFGCGPIIPPVPPTPEIRHLSISEAETRHGKFPDNYQTLVKEYMRSVLKDPDSAKYSFIYEPEAVDEGWAIKFMVNSKNSFGGYTGNQLGACLIKNGVPYDCRVFH